MSIKTVLPPAGLRSCDVLYRWPAGKRLTGVLRELCATYYFISAEHKAQFEKEPGNYAPLFGGYCAFAVSRGATAPISVDAFQILHGQLVLQKNKDILKRWQKDSESNFQKAEANWPRIVQKNAEKK